MKCPPESHQDRSRGKAQARWVRQDKGRQQKVATRVRNSRQSNQQFPERCSFSACQILIFCRSRAFETESYRLGQETDGRPVRHRRHPPTRRRIGHRRTFATYRQLALCGEGDFAHRHFHQWLRVATGGYGVYARVSDHVPLRN